MVTIYIVTVPFSFIVCIHSLNSNESVDVPESSTDQQDSQVYSDDGADYVENRFVIDE